MLITSCYRGSSDNLSGVTFNTENKTFKTWSLKAEQWSHTYQKGRNLYSVPNSNFKVPGDIYYYHVYKRELTEKIEELKKLGFKEDDSMTVVFFEESKIK